MKIIHNEDEQQFNYNTIELSGEEKYPMHWHGNIELIYVEKGCIRLSIRKRTYDVRTGEFAIINSCDHHAYQNGYSASSTIFKQLSVSPMLLSNISKLRLNFSYIAKNENIDKLNIRTCLDNALAGIESERGAVGKYSDALTGAYTIQLILNLQKTYMEKEDVGTTINVEYERLFKDFENKYENSQISEKTMSKFQLILDYLDKNFNDTSLTLTTLSEISSLSECYISELFTLIVGIKFKQYLNTMRINYALRLLSMSDISISGAAYESGFETIRTFNSAFKRLKGVTPSEYLNGVKGKKNTDGIITEIRNLCASDEAAAVPYFPGSCDIRIVDDPEGKRGKVFGLYANSKNKSWTTFNIGMLFKPGKKYIISCDVYPLDDVNGEPCIKNVIGTNLFYPEGDSDAKAHSCGGLATSTGEAWRHIECVVQVSEDYVPGVFDKFSVFGNPGNDVGINFLLDNICCFPAE